MKAVALFSGGLDSTLAIKTILEQGIEVEALKFTSPFCQCDRGGKCFSIEAAEELGIPVKTIQKGNDYLELVAHPKFGYGSGMNPCIDCRIHMLKKAKEYAENAGAELIVTGEVLGQRPMSQHRAALRTIEKEAGLEGRLLRPLSAKCLPETQAERKGVVNREKLLDITGRSRKRQYALARNYDLHNFSCPAGGCLLTDTCFARKLRDLINHGTRLSAREINLLKVGRHFRHNEGKIIAGRNESENNALLMWKEDPDYLFEVQDCGSPVTILRGAATDDLMQLSAEITASYSDSSDGHVRVHYRSSGGTGVLNVKKPDKSGLSSYRV
jgi:tRNA-uridine 2-sulfurtransferase